jgi:GSCFA family
MYKAIDASKHNISSNGVAIIFLNIIIGSKTLLQIYSQSKYICTIMQFQIQFPIEPFAQQIQMQDAVMLIGSCFTEHISKHLQDRKINVLQNPHGILFNPVSVHASLRDVMRKQVYAQDHLFYHNEMWHSWLHHSRFSGITPQEALDKMNNSINQAHAFLQNAKWLIITLGSAFAYRHNDLDMHVSNNHRAPSQWFTKELLPIDAIQCMLQESVDELKKTNPELQIIFTISPVRHLRDGVVENNKSKARLLEAVHQCIGNNPNCHYFPSYEIVIDELRDYRFYDIDFAHPNYMATQYVWQRFAEVAISAAAKPFMDAMHQLKIAMNHKAIHPSSEAHQQFLKSNFDKCVALEKEYSFIDLSEEKKRFGG